MADPSTLDDSLAPAGSHVASLFCQHFPYDVLALGRAPRRGQRTDHRPMSIASRPGSRHR